MTRIFPVFSFSFLASFFFTPLVRKIALALKVLDYPAARKIHAKPIPLMGGLAIALPFLLILWLLRDNLGSDIHSLLLGGILILILGLFDDVKKLSARLRLFIQIIVALVLIASSITIAIFPKTALGLILRYLITIAWVVGITNALNYLDGMDGLCTGLSFIASICFAIIAFFTEQQAILIISLALAGCCLGFLPYNLPSAKIFLGEAGSTFLGFFLAGIGLMGVWAEDNIAGLAIPILILGVPIFDMVFTTIMRIKEKKISSLKQWLEYAGKDHFHHRLVDLGLRLQGAVIFIYLVAICLGISALVLLRATWKIAILLLVQATVVFAMIGVLMVVGSRRKSGWDAQK